MTTKIPAGILDIAGAGEARDAIPRALNAAIGLVRPIDGVLGNVRVSGGADDLDGTGALTAAMDLHSAVEHWHARAVKAEAERDALSVEVETSASIIRGQREEIDAYSDIGDLVRAANKHLRAERVSLRAALSALEWSGFGLDENGECHDPYCPTCEGVEPNHKAGCGLDGALTGADGGSGDV